MPKIIFVFLLYFGWTRKCKAFGDDVLYTYKTLIDYNYATVDHIYDVTVNITANFQGQNGYDNNVCHQEGYDGMYSSVSKELIRISAWNQHINEQSHVGWDVFFDITFSAELNFTSISIYQAELHGSQERNYNTSTCISMALQPHENSPSTRSRWYKLLTIRPLPTVRSVKMEVVATADKTYRQVLYFLSPLPTCISEDSCPMDRFVYTDCTTVPKKDSLHIAEASTTTQQHNYKLLLKTEEDEFELVRRFTDDSKIREILPESKTKLYKIVTEPRKYTGEIIGITIMVILVIISATAFLLWYRSIPTQKTLLVIYCQCDGHALSVNALRKILDFMEKNCLVRIEDPARSNDNSDRQLENEVLLENKSRRVDCVIFVPFPTLEDHERSSEGEVHEICDRYKNFEKKVELLLPMEDKQQGWSPGSEWPRGTFTDFQLLQELPQFIRYIHPCYYPSCLERFLRPKLSGPYLSAILRNHTYTNDHIREITDPKINRKAHSENVVPILNLDLDSIL